MYAYGLAECQQRRGKEGLFLRRGEVLGFKNLYGIWGVIIHGVLSCQSLWYSLMGVYKPDPRHYKFR